jgi:hypothetical protein
MGEEATLQWAEGVREAGIGGRVQWEKELGWEGEQRERRPPSLPSPPPLFLSLLPLSL